MPCLQHDLTDASAVNDIAIHEPSGSSQPENVLPEPPSQTDGTEYENVITISSQAEEIPTKDIINFLSDDCHLVNNEKLFLIKNRATKKNFKFPSKMYKDKRRTSGEMKRYCSHDWFKYTFLSYSKSADGLICMACALFPMPAHQGSRTLQKLEG